MSGLPNPRRDPPPMPPVRAPRDPEAELRDMFAAYAMQGLVAGSHATDGRPSRNRPACVFDRRTQERSIEPICAMCASTGVNMLSFIDYPAEFGPPSFSAEMHGDEPKPLMSIYVEAVVNAANLESFKAGLREALWFKPASNDSARMDDAGKVHELVRRFPTMKTINFDDKLGRGYSLTIKGDLLDDARTWGDVEVGKVSIEPQDGGTARVKFRVQARGEGLEWWVGMLNQGRSITLTPPPAGYVADDDGDDDSDDDGTGDVFAGTDLARDADSRVNPIDQPNGDQPAQPAARKRGKRTNGSHEDAPPGLDPQRLAEADKDAKETADRKAARQAKTPAGVH